MNRKFLIIHCTGANKNQTTQSILDYWRNVKKWKSVGYHKLISDDGTVEQLADLDSTTNGVKGKNSVSWHLCYKGGVQDGKAKDTRSEAAKTAMLKEIYKFLEINPDVLIMGHRDIGSFDSNRSGKIDIWERIKECPSFDVFDWLDSEDFRYMENVKRVL